MKVSADRARPRTILTMPAAARESLLGVDQTARLHRLCEVVGLAESPTDDPAGVQVMLTGWGSPLVDPATLDQMPNLRLVAHTAGSVRGIVDAETWRRGLVVTNAAAANAVPVAEYTLAMILLACKNVLGVAARYRHGVQPGPGWSSRLRPGRDFGNYRPVVGIISASQIGRLVMGHLRHHDHQVLVYDPFLSAPEAAVLGATRVDLGELFDRSDVVSLHAPNLPATHGLVSAELLARLREGATFINTARAPIVDNAALRAELRCGRINAVLDVTAPEPLLPQDELFALPNVLITPHWAGSLGNELYRLADQALDNVEAWIAGHPPPHAITLERLALMA